MSFITAALIGGGAALIGASMTSSAARSGASAQAAAADRAAELQQQQFERQVELQAPFREAGVRALPELEAASRYTPFGMQQFQADPGYGFRLAEGQKALEAQAAMRGGLISGNALRAASRYGQEMGSQEYTNAFNRYQTERQARLNPLQSLAGMAQTSVNQLGQAGQTMATNVGEAGAAAAQARASGYMGGASALSGALGTGSNLYMQSQFMNRMFPGGGGGGMPSYGGGGYNVGTEPYAGYNASIGL